MIATTINLETTLTCIALDKHYSVEAGLKTALLAELDVVDKQLAKSQAMLARVNQMLAQATEEPANNDLGDDEKIHGQPID